MMENISPRCVAVNILCWKIFPYYHANPRQFSLIRLLISLKTKKFGVNRGSKHKSPKFLNTQGFRLSMLLTEQMRNDTVNININIFLKIFNLGGVCNART